MTKSECNRKRQITLNLAHYLGVEIDLPECRSNSCPDGECTRCAGDNKLLAKALLSPELTDDERNRVRRENISFGVYSFFSADDCDTLGVKMRTYDSGMDTYSKVIESMYASNESSSNLSSDLEEVETTDTIETDATVEADKTVETTGAAETETVETDATVEMAE